MHAPYISDYNENEVILYQVSGNNGEDEFILFFW